MSININCDQSKIAIRTINLTYFVNKHAIVDNVNLTIPKGKIFSLLGPSGCGKTTLLRCIVGYLKPQIGQISIFNKDHQSNDLCIPGKNVGYMPQESGLFNHMSIGEILNYYGRICMMDIGEIRRRISELIEQLDLPSKSSKIYNLSGGQQRRVSFAIALIHLPPIIVLDEPTCGVDPVLREKVWTLLLNLANEKKLTIIITTHYIEEAKRSNEIAFMREGKILHQSSTINLLKSFLSLESAFLDLCIKENCKSEKIQSIQWSDCKQLTTKEAAKNVPTLSRGTKTWFTIFFALFFRFLRKDVFSSGSLIFQYIIPITQVLIVVYGIGGEPQNVPVGLVNNEIDARLSNQFISSLDKNLYQLHNYTSNEDALNDLEKSKLRAVISIQNGFSEAFLDRIYRYNVISNIAINKSKIIYYSDPVEKLVHFSLIETLYRQLKDFARDVFRKTHKNGTITESPSFLTNWLIKMDKPIFGIYHEGSQSLQPYVFAGCLVSIVQSTASIIFALSIIDEKMGQSYERNFVAGITKHQIVLAMAFSRLLLMIPMIFLISLLPIKAISYPVLYKSVLESVPLQIMVSISGLGIGTLVGACSVRSDRAVLFITSIFFILIFLSGSLWPLESLPEQFRNILKFGPLSMANKAMRNIFYRDAHILTDDDTFKAFQILLSWTIASFAIGLKFFQK